MILKILIFQSFKASGLTFSWLCQRLLKSFNEAAISLPHLGKSILEGNLYLGPLEIILPKVSNGAKIRNRYNQVPHLTQDTNGKVTNS